MRSSWRGALALLVAMLAFAAPLRIHTAAAQELCGTGVCGGGLQCVRCPGLESTCARPPAQCCGNGICGDGLQCMTCPGQPRTCARPPAQCCGSGICGDGLVCVNAPGGFECQRPAPQTPMPQADSCGGAGPCGGGLQCARCPGSTPTCARPPFQCCGSAGPCGGGLVCDMTAPGGPVCARPSSSGLPSQSTSGPIPGGVATKGMFRSRWDQVGGSWTTGWVPDQAFQGCIHGISCACGSENYCGNYASGRTTTAWPQGCGGPRWTIRCTSEPQGASASRSGSQTFNDPKTDKGHFVDRCYAFASGCDDNNNPDPSAKPAATEFCKRKGFQSVAPDGSKWSFKNGPTEILSTGQICNGSCGGLDFVTCQ